MSWSDTVLPFFVPEWTWTTPQVVMVGLLLAAPLVYLGESRGWINLGYSKFVDASARFTLPSRTGMLLIYTPATLIGPLVAWQLELPRTLWHYTVLLLVVAHFAKRCAETLWVHQYSGVTQLRSVLMISAAYSSYAWLLITVAATEVSAAEASSRWFTFWFLPGLALWFAGTLGNAWHHRLLARLRPAGSTAYRIPTGGLFRWVACPHYTLELVAWLGLTVVVQHGAAWALLTTMIAYLAGRSHRTLQWYHRTLPGQVPQSWYRLVPGLY